LEGVDFIWIPGEVLESRARAWFETVSQIFGPEHFYELQRTQVSEPSFPKFQLQKFHTLQDSAYALIDLIAKHPETVILIPDDLSVRRTLAQVLKEAKFALLDPRDPTRLRMDEEWKRILLFRECFLEGFPLSKLRLILDFLPAKPGEREQWTAEWQVLESEGYFSLRDAPVERRPRLTDLERRLGEEIGTSQKHSRFTVESWSWVVRGDARLLEAFRKKPNHQRFFDAFFETWIKEWKSIGLGELVLEGKEWHRRLRERLERSTPPIEKVRAFGGVDLQRLGQKLPAYPKRMAMFGVSSSWFLEPGGSEIRDGFLNASEREKLSREFGVRSRSRVIEERVDWLRELLAHSEVTALEEKYRADGTESDGLQKILDHLQIQVAEEVQVRTHPRLDRRRLRTPLRGKTQLGLRQSWVRSDGTVSISFLDEWSSCQFRAVAMKTWKPTQERLSGPVLWADKKGEWMHACLKELFRDSNIERVQAMDLTELVRRVWMQTLSRGIYPMPPLHEAEMRAMEEALESARRVEVDYFHASHPEILLTDELQLDFEIKPGVRLVGRPDRIDRVEDGLVVTDYKSGKAPAKGQDILSDGRRLQLPAYWLAGSQYFNEPTIFARYFRVSKSESKCDGGIFPVKYVDNSKGRAPLREGAILRVGASSKSLIKDYDVEQITEILKVHVFRTIEEIENGEVRALPKDPDDCSKCPARSFCGILREDDE
jgi:hypothetical protein